ncbi:hypothetical protein MVLG_05351 [Microbotryum lychnidis-dioicae p1A1 Lamole]|uniref:Uncharacterized protein n=1 Tax=Microbotryum lychnidis-dioicae (strain p1A1 Lamole / MvSl-1064) TaxID=683840 RepID=U5HDZ7_USTV1|nr:hypothetical protein MVLG_05351 [Microbotryum lychnidis-dioicae p1A1 Lamole]|eukprot:KDE04188.1 hypothetical protein MVLG_05351 [Microbotryum lychnidis-dioicae p1A1 Lamole]
MEYLCAPQLVPGLPCLSASSALPMTAEELQEHLDREEAGPAETSDIAPRRNRHLFVDSGGNKWIRASVVYVQELLPAYLQFEDQDGKRCFYTKTARIELRMTVACTEDNPRISTRSDFDRKELGGQGAQVEASIGRLNLGASESQVGRLDQEIIEGSRDKLRKTPEEAPPRSSRRLSIGGYPVPSGCPPSRHAPPSYQERPFERHRPSEFCWPLCALKAVHLAYPVRSPRNVHIL